MKSDYWKYSFFLSFCGGKMFGFIEMKFLCCFCEKRQAYHRTNTTSLVVHVSERRIPT